MEIALEDLKDPEDNEQKHDSLTHLISNILQSKIKTIMDALIDKEQRMETRTKDCIKLSHKLTFLITSTNMLHTKLEQQHEKMEQKMSYLHYNITE